MADKNEGNTEIVQEALSLTAQGMSNAAIARHLGVHAGTVRRWFRKLGLPPKKAGFNLPEKTEDEDKLKEDKVLAEIAESQNSPAAKYQHYVAAAGIKLLRDSVRNIKGPKSVRELSELDQLIRRNLGLNAKTGGGASRMQIDISILNNSKADKGGGSLDKLKDKKIIDVDTSEDVG